MNTTAKPELEDALNSHTLALFLGADLPHEVTGLPSRAELAREMARRYHLDESLSLAEVAQRISQAGNRFEFTDFIRNALDTVSKPPSMFHQGVVALVKEHDIKTIITTAYDNLLEVAFQQASMGINCVVRGSDVSFIRPDRPTLIKLYGDAQQPETLVVTDQDHSKLLSDHDKERVIAEVRRAFECNTVVFYGYNLSDPDFKFLFDQIAESQFARLAYAVWPPKVPDADVRMWRDRGIVILDEDPLSVLLSGTPVTNLRPSAVLGMQTPTASATSDSGLPESVASPNTANSISGNVVGRDKTKATIINSNRRDPNNIVTKPSLFVEKRRRAVLVVVLLVAIVIGVLLIRQSSPCDEAVPIIQTFTVHYPEDTTKSFKPGDEVEIMDGERLLVEAKIPGQSAALCKWSTGKGSLTSASGCSTWYSPPLDETNDFLNIIAQAPCNAAKASAGLLIKVVQSRSQP